MGRRGTGLGHLAVKCRVVAGCGQALGSWGGSLILGGAVRMETLSTGVTHTSLPPPLQWGIFTKLPG